MLKLTKYLAISILVALTGCAGVFHGTKQTLTFTSEPDGAEVLVDGASLGVTPLSVKVKKNKYDTVTFKKPGYKSQTKMIETSFDGVALLDIFWDLGTTDFLTGALYEYEPGVFHAVLEPEAPVSLQENKSRTIQNLVLGFGGDIRLQLSKNQPGEELNALLTIIESSNKDLSRSNELSVVSKIANESSNDLVFAQSIISYYKI